MPQDHGRDASDTGPGVGFNDSDLVYTKAEVDALVGAPSSVLAGNGLTSDGSSLNVVVVSGLFVTANAVGLNLSLVAAGQYITISGGVLSGVTP